MLLFSFVKPFLSYLDACDCYYLILKWFLQKSCCLSVWDLELGFFPTFLLCLGIGVLPTLALDYAIAVYPLLLIVVSYLLIALTIGTTEWSLSCGARSEDSSPSSGETGTSGRL